MEATRQAFAAVGRRDLTTLLEHADPEIELHPLTSVWPRTYRGHTGIEQWLHDVGDVWQEFSIDAEGLRDLGGDTLLVSLCWRGRARDGSSELAGPSAAVVRFDGERIASVHMHLDEERALASVTS